MIKRKSGIDNNVALKEACENNDIILTAKGVNSKPVSYVDLKGKEKILDAKFSVSRIIKNIGAEHFKKIAEFNVGDTVRVYGKIKKENGKKVQIFEGVVLKRQGIDGKEIFTVRKNANGIGIEKTWSLHSPNVEKIEIVRRGKVGQDKRNYLKGIFRG